jgi:hypothetical protein
MINTELSLMDYMVTISGSLILILLGAIGYFLKQFAGSVKDLKSTVEQLRLVLSVEQEKVNHLRETLVASNAILDTKVTNLSTRVEQNTNDILVLKTMHDPTKQNK